jgi:hypothetical protein
MSQENVELAREGIAAINDVYRTGDLTPWRRHVEKAFDAEVVLEAGTEAFTEGEWRVFELRDGKAVLWQIFQTREQALEAVRARE